MVRHTCLSIEGAIRNAKDLKGCIEVNGRTLNTVAEIRAYLKIQQSKGYRVLPMCECSNFDFQKGCKGHIKEEADKHKAISKMAQALCDEEATCDKFCQVCTDCKPYLKAKKLYEERMANKGQKGEN